MSTTSTWPSLAGVIALTAAVGCAGPASAPPGEPAPRRGRPERDRIALAVLREASTLTSWGVGERGEVPGQNLALAMLVSAGDAAALRELLDAHEPAAQLFGLVGLAQVDSSAFMAALPAFRDREEPVMRMDGCSGYSSSVATVVSEIEHGRSRDDVLQGSSWWLERDPYHLEEGRTAKQWVERLASDLPAAREALRRFGRDAIPALIDGLEHADVRVRRGAAWRLHDLGPRAYEAVGALARALDHDPDPQVRAAVARALSEVGPWAVDAAPALLRAVALDADPWRFQPEAQLAALDALGSVARYSPAAVDPAARVAVDLRVVERALDDPVAWVRRRAEEVLWDLPRTHAVGLLVARRVSAAASSSERASWMSNAHARRFGRAVVEQARPALMDSDPQLQRIACDVLLEAGERARVELALAEVRRVRNDDPRAIVLAARLDPTSAPAELVAALQAGAPWERSDVTDAAARAGTIGVDALLIDALMAADPAVRHAARRALRDVTSWPELIAVHANRLEDADPLRRIVAAEVVVLLEERQSGPRAHSERARQVLAAALGAEADVDVRRRALEALSWPRPDHGPTPQDLADGELPPWTRLRLARAALTWEPRQTAVLLAARGALAELVSDGTDASLRREAIAALAEDGVARACRRFEDDVDPAVRLHAVMGVILGGEATPERFAQVTHALASSPGPLREWVLHRLSRHADGLWRDEPAPELVEWLTGTFVRALDDPALMDDAVEGLESLGLEPVVRGLDHARSPRAIARLADLMGEVVGWGREPGPAVAALDRALARVRDPRLRYLLTRARETPRQAE